ncbi:MAG: intradiol ring-cleavage dioxygenase [Methyloceanibacter sp.]|uniref:intradiol ring-cleavage dioxygenase n=1 Tax=Methyloceanibacter sp. TaxID=1965321 RepID=UPI003D6D5903
MSAETRSGMTRRQALAGAVAATGLTIAGRPAAAGGRATLADAKVCVLTPEAMEGPFYFDPKLVRADITEGKRGAPLALTLQVVEAETCSKLGGARVDVWHSDGLGVYSGYARQATGSTEGETFLRGTQFADVDGQVRFATIYPGWYPGRTPHIHFKVLVEEKDLVTGQLYFPDAITDRIYTSLEPYLARKAKRDTFNDNDFIFKREGGAETLVEINEEGGRYRAALVIGVDRRSVKRS